MRQLICNSRFRYRKSGIQHQSLVYTCAESIIPKVFTKLLQGHGTQTNIFKGYQREIALLSLADGQRHSPFLLEEKGHEKKL